MEEFTLENCLLRSFDRTIKMQLQPVWHKIGGTTRQLVEDLVTLRKLLVYLTRYDCVSMYTHLETIRIAEGKFGIPKSNWILTDEAGTVFYHAKARVYDMKQTKSPQKRQKTLTQMAKNNGEEQEEPQDEILMNLEENPKWKVLSEVLDEVEQEVRTNKNPMIRGRVLILANDDKTCTQLRHILCKGSKKMLTKILKQLVGVLKQRDSNANSAPVIAAPAVPSSKYAVKRGGKSAGAARGGRGGAARGGKASGATKRANSEKATVKKEVSLLNDKV